MAQDFIRLTQPSDLGNINIKRSVFDSIVVYATQDEKRAMLDRSNLRKSVESKVTDNQLLITVDVKIQYGQNVNEVSESLQNKIASDIEHMTGLAVRNVDIHVVGFYFNAQ